MDEQQENYWGMPLNTFCMLMHLSQFASIIAPGLGIIIPIIMWATNKDKNAVIDQNGKVIFNWFVSVFIFAIICALLWFFFIGMVGFFILAIANLVFVIIAAIKANQGELWPYPLSIKVFKY